MVTPGQFLRRCADWLGRLSARLQRVPITIERSLALGLTASITFLVLAVALLVWHSNSPGAIALALVVGVLISMLLAASYARARVEVTRQHDVVHCLQRDAADLRALHRLIARIQASRSVEALSEAMLEFARAVFPDTAGLVATHSENQRLEVLATWGSVPTVDGGITCYAIRDGQTFSSLSGSHGYRCQHVEKTYDGPYMCFPIKGEPLTAGVLHLRYPAPSDAGDVHRWRGLGEAAAARVAIGLEAIELHRHLRTLSMVDPLTGLINRRALFDQASRVHAEAIGKRATYSVILADVDRFKALNDALGHSAGDAILVTFARHVQRLIRSQDFACRYGGEEFVVLMPDTSREVAVQRAEVMRMALGSLRTSVPGSVWQLSASFGVAAFPVDGNSFSEILRRADEAMYDSKLAGRNRVTSASQPSRRA